MSNPIVTIEMEDGGIIRAELYPEIAPNTVRNFISLVKKGFYDGVIFHRVIPGFMIQGGDPTGTGMGGPGYSIEGEFTSNGFQNDLKHTRGVLSMARAMDPNSAGSQFFIMHMDAPHLDEKLSAGLDRAVHGQQQHPLLLLVDGVDGKAAVRIVIAGRPVDGGVDKVPAEEARVVSAPLPQRLNGRV